MISVIEENVVDLCVDCNGQPIVDTNGKEMLIEGDECWVQDVRLEALTEENELFYEMEEDGYGFGLLDFKNAEYDEFLDTEIKQRITEKLAKRTYIDGRSIETNIAIDKKEQFHIEVSFSKNDSNAGYNLDITENSVEVILDD